jgi:hypothetical protein
MEEVEEDMAVSVMPSTKTRRRRCDSTTMAKIVAAVGPWCAGVLGHGLSLRLHRVEEETEGILIGGKNGRWRHGVGRSMK